MELDEFRSRLLELHPMHAAWGAFICNELTRLNRQADITPQILSSRVKDTESAVGKIARKGYTSPLTQMTDLVGVRLVVLLTPELYKIRQQIETSDKWEATLARDPDKEAELAPETFQYQSLHFELRAPADLEYDGARIARGTCCEFQARTLLQHAYAEVVHDNMYKSAWDAPARAQRFVASSAALISTAEHLFCETMEILAQENRDRGELLEQLGHLYESKIHGASGKDQKLNMIVLDKFGSRVGPESVIQISEFLEGKPFLKEKIQERLNHDPFWSQPVSLLAYWLVDREPRHTFDAWPFASSHDALRLIYSDLGKRPPQ